MRLEQVAQGKNTFSNIDDSQPDLNDIPGYYIEPGGNFWVAHEHGALAIIGFVAIRNDGNGEGQLKRLAVLSKYRGRRIGSGLVNTAVEWSRTSDIRRLTLSTGKNETAKSIYERSGFRDCGFDEAHQDFLMELSLEPK